MNVRFVLNDPTRHEAFLAGAAQRGLLNLRGHRALGGLRASLYNAMPLEGVEALLAYLWDFEHA
jgi:phosphoserine aminotransferase